jgi:hypothetical protein
MRLDTEPKQLCGVGIEDSSDVVESSDDIRWWLGDRPKRPPEMDPAP